jgi:hypothetical protein
MREAGRSTPTRPSLRRGQTGRYGPTVIEARRSLRRRLPGAERVARLDSPHYQPLLVSVDTFAAAATI